MTIFTNGETEARSTAGFKLKQILYLNLIQGPLYAKVNFEF